MNQEIESQKYEVTYGCTECGSENTLFSSLPASEGEALEHNVCPDCHGDGHLIVHSATPVEEDKEKEVHVRVVIECQECGDVVSFAHDDVVEVGSDWNDGEKCAACDDYTDQTVIECEAIN